MSGHLMLHNSLSGTANEFIQFQLLFVSLQQKFVISLWFLQRATMLALQALY